MPQTRTNKKRDSEAADDTTDKKGDEQQKKPTEEPENAKKEEKTEPTSAGKTEDELESEPKRQKTEEEDAGENKEDGEGHADDESPETIEGGENKGSPKVEESASDPVEAKKVQEMESGAEQQKVVSAPEDAQNEERKQRKKRADAKQLRPPRNGEISQDQGKTDESVDNSRTSPKSGTVNHASDRTTPRGDYTFDGNPCGVGDGICAEPLANDTRIGSSPDSVASTVSSGAEGKTKTKKVVKVVRKVDGATIKREMTALQGSNDELKRENGRLLERMKEMEEECKIKDQKIEQLKNQLIAVQFLKSTSQASPRGKHRSSTSLCEGTAEAQITGIKLNKPAIGGRRVSEMWEEKFRLFQQLPRTNHRLCTSDSSS